MSLQGPSDRPAVCEPSFYSARSNELVKGSCTHPTPSAHSPECGKVSRVARTSRSTAGGSYEPINGWRHIGAVFD